MFGKLLVYAEGGGQKYWPGVHKYHKHTAIWSLRTDDLS